MTLVEELKRTKEGGFLSIFLVADQSGYIELTLWNNEAAAVQPGMILVLTNVYVHNFHNPRPFINPVSFNGGGIYRYTQIFQERLRICIPKHGGSVKRVGEFTMIVHADSPNISDKRWIVDPSNSSRFIEKPNGTASCK